MNIINDIKRIQNTEKDIRYTYGFTWKNPTTNKVLVTKEKAIEILNSGNYAHYDLTDTEEYLHLNLFSANDMW